MAGWLALIGGIGMACVQWLIFYFAPIEVNMGIIQKIFYFHLPLSWWALFSFFLVFAGSIIVLLKKSEKADNFCRACAEVGVLFSGLALLTGMIWAKRSWGVWWTWDPRLTSTLILWLIYNGYLLISMLEMNLKRQQIVRAVLGVAAFLDVPLVFFSARLFRSAHPVVFASKTGGLEPEMWFTALAVVIAMGLLWAGLVLLRKSQIDLETALHQQITNLY